MIEKIKQYLSIFYGGVILILAALLFRQEKKTQSAESQLANAVALKEIDQNEHDREIAKSNADSLVNAYDKLRGDK
jgi:hypothetical protein